MGMFTNKRFINRRFGSAAGSAAGSNIVVDLWETFEFSTPVDSAAWKAALEANDSSSVAWTVTTDVSVLSTSSAAERTAISTINGSPDIGTLGVQRAYTSAVLDGLQFNIGSDKTSISVGTWFKYSGTMNADRILFRVQDSGGTDVVSIRLLEINKNIRLTGSGNSDNSSALSIDTWYWITFQANRNGTSLLKVFDVNGLLVGSECSVSTPNFACRRVFIFNNNSDLSSTNNVLYVDDFCTDWTSATYPLGP